MSDQRQCRTCFKLKNRDQLSLGQCRDCIDKRVKLLKQDPDWQRKNEEATAQELKRESERPCFVCWKNKPFHGARWCVDCAIEHQKRELGKSPESDAAIFARIELLKNIQSKGG